MTIRDRIWEIDALSMKIVLINTDFLEGVEMLLLRLPSLVLSLVLLGCPIAAAVPPPRTVQHLTCTQELQKLTCTSDDIQAPVVMKQRSQSTIPQPDNISAPLAQLSSGLIGLMFVGLPIALALVIILHLKQDVDRTKRIEKLERIWQRS